LIAGWGRLLPLLQNFHKRIRIADRSPCDGIGSFITGAEQTCRHPNREIFALR
jgi:hypothetical protein